MAQKIENLESKVGTLNVVQNALDNNSTKISATAADIKYGFGRFTIPPLKHFQKFLYFTSNENFNKTSSVHNHFFLRKKEKKRAL